MKRFTSYDQANKWLLKIVKETNNDALKAVSQQAYKDVKDYTYWDTGEMYASGSIHSDFSKGLVTMISPQVRRLYYGDYSAGAGNRRAIPFWWDRVAQEQCQEYKKMYIKLFKYNER